MSWKLVGTPKTMLVDRRIALEYASMDPAPHDRPLSERRLMVYERLFKDGQFRPVTWAKAYCEETAGTYRVNGKHTSTLLSTMEMLPEFYVTIEEYNCQKLEDVANLYSTFDSTMQSRSASDIYMSFAGTCKELRYVDRRTIISCAAALPYNKHGGDMYRLTQPADRAEMVLDHVEFVCWLDDTLKAGPTLKEMGGKGSTKSPHLCRQPVIAAMFACYQRDKQDCNKFWVAVRDETGKHPDTPDRKIARYLSGIAIKNHTMGRGHNSKDQATLREIYVKCLHAWNSWRTNKPTRLQYYVEADLPEVR